MSPTTSSVGAGGGLTISNTDVNGFDSESYFQGLSTRGDFVYVMGTDGTGYRIYKTTSRLAVSDYSSGPDAFQINGLELVAFSSTVWPQGGDTGAHIYYVSGQAGTGNTGNTGNTGGTGATGPIGGATHQYMFNDGNAGASGNTGLQYDPVSNLPKFVTYRERIHDYTDSTIESGSDTLTIDAANGPVQRIRLTTFNSSINGLNISNLTVGQGVTIIIDTPSVTATAPWNVTNATVNSSSTSTFYNAAPEFVTGSKTMIYILGYGADNTSKTVSELYITSQRFISL
jgi:hypothetical protein